MVVGPTLDFANICAIADKVTWTITELKLRDFTFFSDRGLKLSCSRSLAKSDMYVLWHCEPSYFDDCLV